MCLSMEAAYTVRGTLSTLIGQRKAELPMRCSAEYLQDHQRRTLETWKVM